MFGIGMPELILILVIALVVLGPEKLPGLAKAIGRGIGEFKRATDELKHSLDKDDELRGLKDTLNQARNEVSDMVRDQMRAVQSEKLAKALEDGSLFGGEDEKVEEKKPEGEAEAVAAETAAVQPAPIEEPASNAPEPAEAVSGETPPPSDPSAPSDESSEPVLKQPPAKS